MKKKCVVFMDFDGPLFSSRALMLPQNNEYAEYFLNELNLNPLVWYWYADPVAVSMLNQLMKVRSFKIVISNNWANNELHKKEDIMGLLEKNNLTIPLHNAWKNDVKSDLSRPLQISKWLSKNQVDDYMIIDDNESGMDFKNYAILKEAKIPSEKVVLVNNQDGILMNDFEKMKRIMQGWY